MAARCLYLTYNGLTDHIGQAQVLPYLLGLADRGNTFTVVSMERRARLERHAAAVRSAIGARAISLVQRPAREGRMLFNRALEQRDLAQTAARQWQTGRFDFVHCRSYVPASIGLKLKRRFAAPFIFDMRGFWVDQRIDGGLWDPRSPIYRAIIRTWRGVEDRAIGEADAIVVLTDAARRTVEARPSYRGAPVTVIPCAVAFDEFDLRPTGSATRRELGFNDADTVLVYLGSLGSVYLLDDMLRLFASVRTGRRTRLLCLGAYPQEAVDARAAALGLALAPGDVVCREVDRAAVPDYLAAADVGLCFVTPGRFAVGMSPTKIGEYFACGLPVIANAGIGDVAAIFARTGCGLVIPDFSDASAARAAAFISANCSVDRARVRAAGRPIFELSGALHAYDSVYATLLQARSTGRSLAA